MVKIIGQKLSFKTKTATNFYIKTLRNWNNLIKNKEIIIFLPCASTKPIQNSPTHCFLSPITRFYEERILKVIVSEPLTLIPYHSKSYPNYDYPPEKLRKNKKEKEIFINRLKKFKDKTPKNIKCYYIGGKHHYDLLIKSGWKVRYFYPKRGIVDYNSKAHNLHNQIFNKPKAVSFKTIKLNTRIVEISPNFL